jgi:hypothetical protein
MKHFRFNKGGIGLPLLCFLTSCTAMNPGLAYRALNKSKIELFPSIPIPTLNIGIGETIGEIGWLLLTVGLVALFVFAMALITITSALIVLGRWFTRRYVNPSSVRVKLIFVLFLVGLVLGGYFASAWYFR